MRNASATLAMRRPKSLPTNPSDRHPESGERDATETRAAVGTPRTTHSPTLSTSGTALNSLSESSAIESPPPRHRARRFAALVPADHGATCHGPARARSTSSNRGSSWLFTGKEACWPAGARLSASLYKEAFRGSSLETALLTLPPARCRAACGRYACSLFLRLATSWQLCRRPHTVVPRRIGLKHCRAIPLPHTPRPLVRIFRHRKRVRHPCAAALDVRGLDRGALGCGQAIP